MISLFLAPLAALGLPWSLTNIYLIVLDSKPSSLPDQTPHLANLMGVIRKHDLTNKKTTKKTNTNTKTMTMKMTNTFREHLQRAISETFDL